MLNVKNACFSDTNKYYFSPQVWDPQETTSTQSTSPAAMRPAWSSPMGFPPSPPYRPTPSTPWPTTQSPQTSPQTKPTKKVKTYDKQPNEVVKSQLTYGSADRRLSSLLFVLVCLIPVFVGPLR